MDQPAWGALAFDVTSALVEALQASLPRHHALAALSALRLVNRHLRVDVDDALHRWEAPPTLLGGSSGGGGSAGAAGTAALAALLRRFRNLRTLSLYWPDVPEHTSTTSHQGPPTLGTAVLEALSSLRRLESLCLGGCKPTAPLFRAIAALPRLRCFSFEPATGEAGVGDGGGDGGRGGGSGGSGGGWRGAPGASPAPLAGCAALESLELRSFYVAGMEADLVAVLRGATGLQHLCLYRSIRPTAALTQQSFSIGFATKLTCLELRCTHTTDDAFATLFAQLTRLRRVDISGSAALTDDGLRGITRLAGSLTGLVLQGGHRVSEDGATALALLTGLQSLDLGFSNNMSGDSLLPLVCGALTRLTLLDIHGCPRACDALHHLPRMHRLRHLSVQGCRLQPRNVATLARLTWLCHLDLADNPRLGALEALTALRELQFLDASECALQDAHLVHLLASLPQARTILLNSNRDLSTAVLEALAAGRARITLKVLGATGLQLEGEALGKLLPQLAALQELDVSAGQCASGGMADAEALLEAADAMPALHTLTARGLMPLPAQEWRELVQATADRRRLLRVLA